MSQACQAAGRKYGWKPSLPTAFAPTYDEHFAVQAYRQLPSKQDLGSQDPNPYDQLQEGSCTANMGAGLFEHLQIKEKVANHFTPSRQAIYYWERELEGTTSYDAGASITDTMSVLSTKGAPHEGLWPYDLSKLTVKPPAAVEADGRNHLVTSWYSIDNTQIYHLKSCLAYGYPFGFGFTVYKSFESQAVADTGMMPMPRRGEQILGGHATLAIGFDDSLQCFLVRNSWGMQWGCAAPSRPSIRGYFYMPYAFMTSSKFASDFWTARIAA